MYVCMYARIHRHAIAASFAMKDFDLLFDHVVDNFQERLKCASGAGVMVRCRWVGLRFGV